MSLFQTFILSVLASVVAYYLCKWLDTALFSCSRESFSLICAVSNCFAAEAEFMLPVSSVDKVSANFVSDDEPMSFGGSGAGFTWLVKELIDFFLRAERNNKKAHIIQKMLANKFAILVVLIY